MIGPEIVRDVSPASAGEAGFGTKAAGAAVLGAGAPLLLETADTVDSLPPHPATSTAAVRATGANNLRILILPARKPWLVTNPASTKPFRTPTKTAGGISHRLTGTTRCSLWRALPFRPE